MKKRQKSNRLAYGHYPLKKESHPGHGSMEKNIRTPNLFMKKQGNHQNINKRLLQHTNQKWKKLNLLVLIIKETKFILDQGVVAIFTQTQGINDTYTSNNSQIIMNTPILLHSVLIPTLLKIQLRFCSIPFFRLGQFEKAKAQIIKILTAGINKHNTHHLSKPALSKILVPSQRMKTP